MKSIDTSALICFKRLPSDWGNPYYDSLVIVKYEKYHVKYFHTETGLLNTGTTYDTLEKAIKAFETILSIGSNLLLMTRGSYKERVTKLT